MAKITKYFIWIILSSFWLSARAEVTDHVNFYAKAEFIKKSNKKIANNLQQVLTDLLEKAKNFPPQFSNNIEKILQHQISRINKRPISSDVKDFLIFLKNEFQKSQSIHLIHGTFHHQPADYLAIGYLAFYVLPQDQKNAFYWNKQTKMWMPLHQKASRSLQKLWQMKKEYRPYDWINLPISDISISNVHLQNLQISNPAKDKFAIFSPQDQYRIQVHLDDLYKQLQHSSLFPLLQQINQHAYKPFVRSSKELCSQFFIFTKLLQYSWGINKINFPNSEGKQIKKQKTFLFIGPFTILSGRAFFYTQNHQLIKAKKQPYFKLASPAINFFFKNNPTLLPLDPLAGQVLQKENTSYHFFSFIQKSKITFLILIAGLLILLVYLLRFMSLGYKLIKINKQFKNPQQSNINNVLGQLLFTCLYQHPSQHINTMYYFLSTESKKQAATEKRLLLYTIIFFFVGFFTTFASISHHMINATISSSNMIYSLIPFMLSLIFCILFLIIQGILSIKHQFFLHYLENKSWIILFKDKIYRNKIC